MPTSKLILLGVVALGAAGVTLNGYLKIPWRDGQSQSTQHQFERLGYLTSAELPNAAALIPPPPAQGSAEMKRDEDIRNAALQLKGTPRYELAAQDAVRVQQSTIDAFQCAFGTAITIKATPRLYELLSRVRLDVRAASYPAKRQFQRPRPFAAYGTHSCYRDDEAMVQEDGSYPSARGAVGYAYAMVLAKLNPKRADQILQRGQEFGQSRVVCDQEWQSDIDAGATIAKATLQRVEGKTAYQVDYAVAQKEVAAELAGAVAPARSCRAETLALASR